MIYEFECKTCNLTKEEYRKVEDCSLPCDCDMCGKPMKRLFTTAGFTIFNSYFNEGLGIKVNKKSDIRNEINKVKDTTGVELVEVGNEKQKNKRPAHSYKLTKDEYQQAKQIIKGE